MNRRELLQNSTLLFSVSLSGCTAGLDDDDDCHCGKVGPPKGILIHNEGDTDHTVAFTASLTSSENEQPEFTEEITISAGQARDMSNVATQSGEYRFLVDTAVDSAGWVASTGQCGDYLFKIVLDGEEISRQQPGCD